MPFSSRQQRSRSVFLCLCLAASALLVVPCAGEYLSGPSLRWSLQLDESGGLSDRGMRKGNAIVAHNDGTRVIATADDGSLHIVQTAPFVKTLAVFEPPSFNDKYTECRSGATIVYPLTNEEIAFADSPGDSFSSIRNGLREEYVVYAVVDASVTSDFQFDEAGFVQPVDNGDSGSTTSRVVAVDMDGRLKWSVQVPGRIQGDVVVGTTGMYVSHNIGDTGFISVIMTTTDQSSADLVATLTLPDGSNGPFTGPTLQQNSDEIGDIIVVAESWGQGYDETQGGLFMLSPSSEFEDTGGEGNESYDLRRTSSWPNSAFAPPLISGDSVFLGAAGANFAAWTGNQRNDLSGITSGRVDEIDPRFVYQMPTNQRNASQPILSTPVTDSLGEVVCSAGVDSDFYCLSAENGRSVWAEVTDSEVMVRPIIWEDESGSVVYSIESRNGRIRQYDLYTGEIYWDYSCADINGLGDLCQASVEAEFAIAPSGNVIYYGDIFGRITSLEIAAFATETPTSSPTNIEADVSTEAPTESVIATAVPEESIETTPPNPEEGNDEENANDADSPISDAVDSDPDSLNSQQESQPSENKDSTNIGIYIGAALGGLCVLLVPFVVFSLMRSRNNDKVKANEMHVEIVDDVDDDDYARDLEGQDFDNTTDRSSSDGIEIQYTGVKPAPMTPVKRKKKKRKKSPVQTPQTAVTLEAIEELPEEATTSNTEDVEVAFESINLARKFDMVAYNSSNSGSSSGSNSDSSDERSDASSPVSTGDVGVASGSNHLELVVGESNNRSLTALEQNGTEQDQEDEGATSDEDEAPPPPPPKPVLASSNQQWSWGSLLQIGSSNSSKKKDPAPATGRRSTSTQKVTLRPVSASEAQPKEDSKVPSALSPDPLVDEMSRAETPPVSNHGAMSPASSHFSDVEDDDRQLASPASWPSASDMSPTPVYPTEDESKSNVESNREKAQLQTSTKKVEEEKKDEEESYGQQLSRAVDSAYNAISPAMFFTESLDAAPQDPRRALSPNEQSQESEQIHSPISPERCSSVLSADDSLFTSATGATGDRADDTSNLSPLSTNLFDRDILRKERSDIPHDEATALTPPDLNQAHNDRFRYLDDESVPEDEIIPAPGFQYMAGSNHQDKTKADKYGKSVRSKKQSFANQLSKTNSQDSADSGSASPLTAIYNQLASMGQKQADEKKTHSFKRRSKRMEREPTPEPTPEDQLEDTSDTWSSFLQELAEAEQQFFAPTSKASLLETAESQDSDDSEVARINNV